MFNIKRSQSTWHGKKLVIETGKIGRKAESSIIVKYSDTIIMVNVTTNSEIKDGVNFFPLTVNYTEKYYANGKFPGGFIKRESRPSEREILISRIIDRAIRPLFPKDFFQEVNINCTLLSYDEMINTELITVIGVIAALKISSLPFKETLGISKIGLINNKLVPIISPKDNDISNLDLTVIGTNKYILMIESSSYEIKKEEMIQAIKLAQKEIFFVTKIIEDFVKLITVNKIEYKKLDYQKTVKTLLNKGIDKKIEKLFLEKTKKDRIQFLKKIQEEEGKRFSNNTNHEINTFNLGFKELKKEVLRKIIIEKNIRTDKRKFDEVRNIYSEINLLPKTHGSSLFTRGETQAIATVTLGSSQDMQIIDNITGVKQEHFMLHYNFLPYSVGECGQLRAPSRRELGHGKLAVKAIQCVLPKREKFPYTIRVVCEITESNGSSSMATICASSMALMDAGVPTKSSVSGIAMGLIMKEEKCIILSDISAEEDELGDMDFKIATTEDGITALQMDVKIKGITIETIKKTIEEGQRGTSYIRRKMISTIDKPNNIINENAPILHTININKNKIKDLIGPGGKIIKSICEQSNAKIDIDNKGKISIYSINKKKLKLAIKMIRESTSEPVIGNEYDGYITSIKDFGIFIKFYGNKEGLVHISEIINKRIYQIKDIFKEKDKVRVKLINLEKGKYKLTMKNILQNGLFCDRKEWKDLT